MQSPFPYNEVQDGPASFLSQRFPFVGDRIFDEAVVKSLDLEDAADAPLLGALPLYYYGCTHSDVLVVTGPNAGTVWYDGRGVDFGFLPYLRLLSGKMRLPEQNAPRKAEEAMVGFLDWFETYLKSGNSFW